MQIPTEKLKELLVNDGLVTLEVFDETAFEAARMGHSLADTLISKSIITKDYYKEILSNYFGVGLANLSSKNADEKVLRLLPEEISREKRAILFRQEEDGSIGVAMEDPSNLEII